VFEPVSQPGSMKHCSSYSGRSPSTTVRQDFELAGSATRSPMTFDLSNYRFLGLRFPTL
jgi:hypothetical protein